MKFIKTGIAGFDEFLRGGLPPIVLLLIGQPGSGSEVFARGIAYHRSRSNGATYLTINKHPDFVKEDMFIYGWNISKLEQSGAWRFINPSKEESVTDIAGTEVSLNRCVVVDSLSELILTHGAEEGVALIKNMITQNKARKELHMVLLTQGMQDHKVETALEHFAEGILLFNTNWEAQQVSRNIIIKKMAGTIAPTRSLPYSVNERGISIETAIRIT